MSENETSEKDTYGYWLVAFIDLLGQKDAFLKADFLPVDDPTRMKEFLDAVKASVGVIHTMRSLLETFRTSFATTTVDENSPLYGLPTEQIARAVTMKAGRVREHRWSDGVVLACSLKPEPGHSPIMGVYEIVCTCGALMLTQLAMGRPIRGGLDVGIATEVDGELFGAAVVKAYQNESQHAQYPRIVVGKGLVQYLQHLEFKSHDPAIGENRRFELAMARGVRELLLENFDGDGEWILDYAGSKMQAVMPHARTAGLLADARAFAHKGCTEFQARGKQERLLFERYSKLVRYLDTGLGASPSKMKRRPKRWPPSQLRAFLFRLTQMTWVPFCAGRRR